MKKILIILFLFIVKQTISQNLNITQLDDAPLWFNPAYTGLSNCNRLGAVYRNQWISPTNKMPFKTLLVYGNVRLPSVHKKGNWFIQQDWMGLGGYIYHDRAGDGDLTTNSARLSTSFHFGELGKSRLGTVSLGIGAGISNKYIDFSKLYFNTQWDNYIFNTDIPNNEPFLTKTYSNYYYNVDLGVNFTIQPRFKDYVANIGIGLNNFNHPRAGLYEGSPSSIIDTRYSIYADYSRNILKKNLLKVFFIENIQAGKNNTVVGFNLYFPDFIEKFEYGLSYRTKRDIIINIKYKYQDWDIKLAYEINHSKLNQYNRLATATQICVLKSFSCNSSSIKMDNDRIISGRGYEARKPFRPTSSIAKLCRDGIYRKSLYSRGDNLFSVSAGYGRIINNPEVEEYSIPFTRSFNVDLNYLYFLSKIYATGFSFNYLRFSRLNIFPILFTNRINVRIKNTYLYVNQSIGYAIESHDKVNNYLFNEVGGVSSISTIGFQNPIFKKVLPYVEFGFQHQSSKIYYAYIDPTSQVLSYEISNKYNFLIIRVGMAFM